MKLSIPCLGQRDPRWATIKLGNSTLTIGSDGCLLVCHAMMLTYYGHEFLPDLLNEVYKSKSVFEGALINFYKAGQVYPDVRAVEYYNCPTTPCDLNKIDNQLNKKQPVIAWVDNINGDSKPDHFVLIIGKTDDGHYLVNDPWMGEEYYFDAKWGEPSRNIYGLRIYEGVPKEVINYADKIKDLEDKIVSLNSTLAEKTAECAAYMSELSQQEKDNEDLVKQLLEARGQRDTAIYEKTQLESKVKYLEEKNIELQNKVSSLEATTIDKYSWRQLMSLAWKAYWASKRG